MSWKLYRFNDETAPYVSKGQTFYGVYQWVARHDGNAPRSDSDVPAGLRAICKELNAADIRCCFPDAAVAESADFPNSSIPADQPWCVARGLTAYRLDATDNPPELAGIIKTLSKWYERTRSAKKQAAERTAARDAERTRLLASVSAALSISPETAHQLVSDLRGLMAL